MRYSLLTTVTLLALSLFAATALPAHAYYQVVDEHEGKTRVVMSWVSLETCLDVAEELGLFCEWVEE